MPIRQYPIIHVDGVVRTRKRNCKHGIHLRPFVELPEIRRQRERRYRYAQRRTSRSRVEHLTLPTHVIAMSPDQHAYMYRDSIEMTDTFSTPPTPDLRLTPHDMTILRWVSRHPSLLNSVVHTRTRRIPEHIVYVPEHELPFPLAYGTRIIRHNNRWHPICSPPVVGNHQHRLIYVFASDPDRVEEECRDILSHTHYDKLFVGVITPGSFQYLHIENLQHHPLRHDLFAAYLLLFPPTTGNGLFTNIQYFNSQTTEQLYRLIQRVVCSGTHLPTRPGVSR